ncbi:MAG TPA: hypothetical protein VM617_05900 [Thermoanaerobaculia bacterium]|nr:hypothetical protein [Thermoanaerobaculia bacterium]
MDEHILATHRLDRERPQLRPIVDDAWSAEAIAACLPPSAPAARRRASARGAEEER